MSDHSEQPDFPPLGPEAQAILDQVLGGESLGASRNIRQINDLFCAIADDRSVTSGETLVSTIRTVADNLIATRGRNTPAIGNAIRLVLKDLDQMATTDPDEVRRFVDHRRATFNAESLRNREVLARYGANLLAGAETVLAFDYSSTMMAILDELAERGRTLRLIVPESRVLDGGRPIANEATERGHHVTFIADMAFGHFLPESDAVLIGAETIFANGDCWNTVGSHPIAVLAAQYQVPYYVATELIKIDPRSFIGEQKPMAPLDYAQLLGHPDRFMKPEAVSTIAPELDNVPAELVTAYVTPRGLLRPEHLRAETLAFLESIGTPIFQP